RLISVERGHDPREFTLVCFGGAGPLHACSLARALGIPRVLVPAMPGALSALGILMSDVVRDYSRTVMMLLAAGVSSVSSAEAQRSLQSKVLNRRDRSDDAEVAKGILRSMDFLSQLERHFVELEDKAAAEFRNEGLSGIATRSVDLRYPGQGYELNVPFSPQIVADFHGAHRKRYGHADESRNVEAVNVRVRMIAASEEIRLPRRERGDSSFNYAVIKQKDVMFDGQWLNTPILERDLLCPGNCLEGPAIVHEYSATTVVPPGCMVHVDEYSNLVMRV